MPDFKVTRKCHEVLTVEAPYHGSRNWQFDALLLADLHLDHPGCDRVLLKKLLDEAVRRGAPIAIIGDALDLMQGRDDRRASKAALKPEYALDYLDSVIEEAAGFLRPYAGNIVMISEGNHESSVRRKLETNPTKRLAKELGVDAGRYAGWIQWRFIDGGKTRTTFNLYFTHGSGGGGPVTKGVIQTNRMAAMLSNAHIVVSSHIHESWQLVNTVYALTDRGQPYTFDQLFVCIGNFKEEYRVLEGYHVEGGRPPKPLGGHWLQFKSSPDSHGRMSVDAVRAR